MPLKVRVEEKGNGMYTIYPEGSIDANTYTILGSEVDAILKKSPNIIIFNMKDVNYVSSAGVGIILIAEQTMNLDRKGTLMVQLQPQIRKVFDIVRALPPEQIFASIEEMDEYLTDIQRKVTDREIK